MFEMEFGQTKIRDIHTQREREGEWEKYTNAINKYALIWQKIDLFADDNYGDEKNSATKKYTL